MDYIQINPDNVAPVPRRPRTNKVAAYLFYRQLVSGGGGIVTDDLVLRSNFYDMANLSLDFPSNGSAVFNGTSDYVQILADGKGSAFDTQEFTIGAWVYVDDTAYKQIWSYDFTSHSLPYYSQHFRVVSGQLQFAWNASGSVAIQITSTSIINTKEWYYVTASFKSGAQKIYIDGSEVASNTRVDTITYYNQEVWIGKGNFAYMGGNLSNVAFWNRALSSDEINSVMWKSYGDLSASEQSGLQAWYSLDNIDGTSVPDSTGNYNGTAY